MKSPILRESELSNVDTFESNTNKRAGNIVPVESGNYTIHNITSGALIDSKLYAQSDWKELILEYFFELKKRGTTVKLEVYCSFLQFVSCSYVLAVVPQQLEKAGYDPHAVTCIVALTCGIGSILCGLLANLPFIIVPPTAVAIFFSVYIQENKMEINHANLAVILTGIVTILLGFRPIGRFALFFIPGCIQIGVAVGIGLFTALAGSTDINLVVTGEYTIVDIGLVTDTVLIAMSGVVIITVALHYHVKPAFALSIFFTTIVFWWNSDKWPNGVVSMPKFDSITPHSFVPKDIVLCFDLSTLTVLFVNGLINTLGDLSGLTRPNGDIPRSRWLYVICGAVTIISGTFNGPPVLISPESAAGIKAGAKTGLSTFLCGVWFLFCIFLGPVFSVSGTVYGPYSLCAMYFMAECYCC